MTDSILDELIERKRPFSHTICYNHNTEDVRDIAVEYSNSEELKIQHWKELCALLASVLDKQPAYNGLLSVNSDGSWYIGGECGLCDDENQGDDLDSLIQRIKS